MDLAWQGAGPLRSTPRAVKGKGTVGHHCLGGLTLGLPELFVPARTGVFRHLLFLIVVVLLPPCFLLGLCSPGLQSHLTGGQDVAAKHIQGGEPARKAMAACDDNLPSAYCSAQQPVVNVRCSTAVY